MIKNDGRHLSRVLCSRLAGNCSALLHFATGTGDELPIVCHASSLRRPKLTRKREPDESDFDYHEHEEHHNEFHDSSIRILAGTLDQGVQQPHRQQIGLEAPIHVLVEPDRAHDEVSCDYFRGDVHAHQFRLPRHRPRRYGILPGKGCIPSNPELPSSPMMSDILRSARTTLFAEYESQGP